MAILKWDSSREIMFIQDRMAKLYEYTQANVDIDINTPSPWVPQCDIYEDSVNFTLKAETPGLRLEDIVLEVSDDTITLVGARKRKRNISDESYHRIERSYGRFVRRFILPCNVDENNVSAKLVNGLLTVTIRKQKTENSRKIIEIKIK